MRKDPLPSLCPRRKATAAAVGLGVLGSGLLILQFAFLSRVVTRVFQDHADLAGVAAPLALLAITVVLRSAAAWLGEVAANHGAAQTKAALRRALFAHLAELGPAYASGERTGELASAAIDGVERLDPYLVRYLPQRYLSGIVPLLIGCSVLSRDLLSGIILLATAPILPLLMALVGSYAGDHMRAQWVSLGRLNAHLLDALHGLPTLKLFGRGEAEIDRVAEVSADFRERTLKVLRYAFLNSLVLEFMATASIAVVAVELGTRLLTGGIAFQTAFWILLLAPEFYRPLRDLGTQRHAAMESRTAGERIAALLALQAPRRHLGTPVAPPRAPLTVTLQDVGFSYPNGVRALEGVDLTLAPGTRTAVVGRTGAGKSTLVNLLLAYMEPCAGSILVNGRRLDEMAADAWRARVALVPQRPYLFAGTVRDNIRLARPDAGDQDVARAAELAGAAEFIADLPLGYDTPMGERGFRLSGGQAQRVALARAFLKDAPLLILDEPTAHLDPESEALIRRALDRLVQGRTVLIVAHRLSTVHTADQIAVLAGGHLVESGRHGLLLARRGAYFDLVHGALERSA